ncbi:MAG: MotA/TolQ/ExbB proton channel family protein [Marinifilaceae bacterium]|nr:MotA/TolQ/ExbB proton channel family protein [Marinifilaceae bacterium]
MLTIGASSMLMAQENDATQTEDATLETTVDENAALEEAAIADPTVLEDESQIESTSFHAALKQKFIEGGAMFMSFVILALIFGLAIAIERVIYLNLASTNSKKLISKVEEALANGGVEAAKETCRNTRGPIASIFYQGLSRYDQGIDMVEKSVVSYGSVQMGLLEKGMSWIALFIALAPMLGFLGTVIGMIDAFDAIQAAGDIQPTLVAGGIKVALITTVGGLIVAMILQVFYNYCVAKIDSIVNDMEDSSVTLLDILVKYNQKH